MPIKTPLFGSQIGVTEISNLWSRAMSYFYTYLGCTRCWPSRMSAVLEHSHHLCRRGPLFYSHPNWKFALRANADTSVQRLRLINIAVFDYQRRTPDVTDALRRITVN